MAKPKKTIRVKPQVVTTLDPRIIAMMDKLCELRICANRSELLALLIREAYEKIYGLGGNDAAGRPAGGIYTGPTNPDAMLNAAPARPILPKK
jgi:hypothetical protein